jgi:hypothetical protein
VVEPSSILEVPQAAAAVAAPSVDPRYVAGQRLLVEAMRYLAQADPIANRAAIELLAEHVRTSLNRVDESATQTADPSPDEPLGPSGQDAPVRAPLEAQTAHTRSGAALAVPEQEQ